MANEAEIHGSPRSGFSYARGSWAEITYRVAWADRITWSDTQLGTQCPLFTGDCFCIAKSIQPDLGKNLGTTTTSSYEYALVTLNYEAPSRRNGYCNDTTYITETIEPSMEFLSADTEGLFWDSATSGNEVLPNEAPGRLQVGCLYQKILHNRTTVPSGAKALIGRINSNSVSPTTSFYGDWTFEANTLLFLPPQIREKLDPTGTKKCDIVLSCQYKPNYDSSNAAKGWNYFWNNNANDYVAIVNKDGTDYLPYKTASFSGVV